LKFVDSCAARITQQLLDVCAAVALSTAHFASFVLPQDQTFDRLIFTSAAVASNEKAPLA